MSKRLLNVFIVLCMIFTLLPVNSQRALADSNDSIEEANVAAIGSTNYTTLQAAIDAAATGVIITLLKNITLTDAVTIDNSNYKSFILDLNGQILDGGNQPAINHNGSGTLIITDFSTGGKVISASSGTTSGTICLNGGSVKIFGGKVENTYQSSGISYAIRNNGSGSVTVCGGVVCANNEGFAILNNCGGSVYVSDGTVSATKNAIYNYSTGEITISDKATVSATESSAICNYSTGKITISDTATVTSAAPFCTIYLVAGATTDTVLKITGGTVQNTANGTAIYNRASGKITIPSGTPVIRGGLAAMNKAPELSSYNKVKVTASDAYDGTPPVTTYDPVDINKYKYLTFAEGIDTSVNNLALTDKLTAPATGVTPVTNITEDAQYTGTVSWNGSPAKFLGGTVYTATVTLTSKSDYTFTGVNQNVFTYTGATSVTNEVGSGNTMIVTIVFPATVTPTYGISLDMTGTYTFLHATVGYSDQTPLTVTVNNTGNQATDTLNVGLSGANYDSFTLSKNNILNIAASGSDTFTVKPNIGLSVGAYTAVVAVSGSSVTTSSFTVSFTIFESPLTDEQKVAMAKAVIESGSYTMTQAYNSEIDVKLELERKINNLSGMSSTGITVTGSAITLTSFTAASAGTAGNPAGANGSFTFTVGLTKGEVSSTTTSVTGTIIATAYSGISDTNAVAAAKTAVVDGTVNVAYGADQRAKTAAVQTYVTGILNSTSEAAEVTAVVTYSSGNTYSVAISKGTVSVTKTITMTVTEAANPDPGPTLTPTSSSTPNPEGKVEKTQQQNGDAPAASVNDSTEDLKTKVLSVAEQAQVAAGKDAKVILKVQDISNSVSAEDKKQIEEKLAAEQQNAADMALLYIDISLYKKVGDQEETRVTETSGKISISIEVPESMWNLEAGVVRTYRVIRIHNGVAEVLEGTYDPVTHFFTFETDRFSTYALIYQDGNTTPVKDNGGISDQLTLIRDFHHLCLTAKADKTSQELTYAKAAGADGYFIYGAKCGQKLKKLAEVGTVKDYTVKKLKQGTYYKFQVKAYKIINGEKVILMTSKVIYSVTKGEAYANPSKVTSDTTSIMLAVGETKNVNCQVVLPKDKKIKNYTAVIRYESSNKVIATVNSKGKIAAKEKGTCYVYAYAQNGVYKKIGVTVQ